MNRRMTLMAFGTGFLLTVSIGLIVSGYTPRMEDLWIVLIYLAGVATTLVGFGVWRWA